MSDATSGLYGIQVQKIDGQTVSMETFRGKVLLIVNTASECGFTPQYKGLEEIWQRYRDEGFFVLGFPCNQFGGQEPGTNEEIAQFCDLSFKVSFPMFAKVDVNGASTHPLFRLLKEAEKGFLGSEGIKWNFTKFLVDRNGRVLSRYGSITKPEAITPDIERALRA